MRRSPELSSKAELIAKPLGDEYVSTEHLLVGLASTEGEAAAVLTGTYSRDEGDEAWDEDDEG